MNEWMIIQFIIPRKLLTLFEVWVWIFPKKSDKEWFWNCFSQEVIILKFLWANVTWKEKVVEGVGVHIVNIVQDGFNSRFLRHNLQVSTDWNLLKFQITQFFHNPRNEKKSTGRQVRNLNHYFIAGIHLAIVTGYCSTGNTTYEIASGFPIHRSTVMNEIISKKNLSKNKL